MKSDIQIARETPLAHIKDVASKLSIENTYLNYYGKHIAKLPISLINSDAVDKSNLILVTAITPTKSGVGKTTVTVGLALGLNKLGKSASIAVREPSLGPCFGMKGGGAGGGYAQVLPMERINLHFTGDFHAITSAHNLISALLDNYIFRNRDSEKGLKRIVWRRVLDVNDRALRNIITGLGDSTDGIPTQNGFDITAASEIMAILCLATDLDNLKYRIGNIILGYSFNNKPFTVNDLGATGAVVSLLIDALEPNLVQTTENTPAFVHGGPFANIAHGCNSIIATQMAMTHSQYVITEAGFGADLGAEKFFNIKCRKGGLNPKLTLLVVTLRALKMHGGVDEKAISQPNSEGVIKGFDNMKKHIDNLNSFGQNIVVVLNKFYDDLDEEIELIKNFCGENSVGFAINNAFAEGGEGAIELANIVIDTIESKPSSKLEFTYCDSDSVKTKIEKITSKLYGASGVIYDKAAEKRIKEIEELGVSHYPICIAKTQYSFSENPKAYGVAKNFEVKVRDIIINNGAEMNVVVMGDIMRMPGLPKVPQANYIDVVDGNIEGLS